LWTSTGTFSLADWEALVEWWVKSSGKVVGERKVVAWERRVEMKRGRAGRGVLVGGRRGWEGRSLDCRGVRRRRLPSWDGGVGVGMLFGWGVIFAPGETD
jgi:hypothetical protein